MKILFFSHDGKLGDAILHTSFVKGIKERLPNAQLFCTTAGATSQFWQRDNRISKSWVFNKKNLWETIKFAWMLRSIKLDYIIAWNLIRAEKLRFLCWLANPKYGVKIYTISDNEHASQKEWKALCNLLPDELFLQPIPYDIPLPKLARKWDKEAILLNCFGNDERRSLLLNEALFLIKEINRVMPKVKIYLTYIDRNQDFVKKIIERNECKQIEEVNCQDDIDRLVSLCVHVKVVITPDTSIVHLASTFNCPVIAIFKKDPILITNWAPKSSNYIIVQSKQNENIHGFSIEEVVKSLHELYKY
ncbi:MAG: glycosyltransferase family 9 protein [Pseudomonadota bacterium]